MTTVIEARNADGSLLGRCDSKCHTAKRPTCRCLCAGQNHGVGTAQALENMRQEHIEFLDAETRAFTQQQTDLFTQEEKRAPLK